MEIYNHPTFQMACQQFDEVADHLEIPDSERDRIKYPKRSLTVALPIHRDDGSTQVFTGYRVQHHLTLGPTKGGLRFHPDVTLGEVAALAMWMSWKCALTGLPYGGAKGGVTCDPTQLSIEELERLTRRYTQEMIPFIGPQVDVMAPDLGTNEQVMAWMMDTYSVHVGATVPSIVTGKPVGLGGSLGRREATGRGVGYLVNRATDTIGLDISKTTAAVQGFGNVGSIAALSLARYGVKIIAVTDALGGVYNSNGLNLWDLEKHVAKNKTVAGFPEAEPIQNEQLLVLPCDILVPAALERQITQANAGKIQCRILAEAANGPTTPEADAILAQRGEIFVLPDVLCNAGGVIVSYFEWVQDLQSFFWGETEVVDKLFRILETAYTQVVNLSRKQKLPMRLAALSLGIKRVQEAKRIRGLFPKRRVDRLRHRDRVLSLKYSTIEACFSVPMLNLTMPNFPFLLAFAVKGLGWKAATVGLMAALPHVCNFLQPLWLAAVSRRLSTYSLLRLTFCLGALPWALALLLPSVGPNRDALFTGMLLVATFANSVASVAWSAAISEVVPERVSGRYFARRNLIFGAWTLVAVMAAGQIVEWNGNSLLAFCGVLCVAGMSRLLGLFFLTRMKFPQSVTKGPSRGISLPDLSLVLRDRNYLLLTVFIGLWGFLLNAAMPFYTVYLVNELGLGIGTVVKMTTLASVGGLVTLKGWGRLCDRFGNRPVLQVAALVWAATAMAMWGVAGPGRLWWLFGGYLLVGAATAGFQLTQFNLMVRLAPAALRPAYVAVFLALTSLLTAAGPILGGEVLKFLPARLGYILGQPILSYHALFVVAALGCFVVAHLIDRVREPAEQPVVNVWREMKTMRTFNPMLSMLAAGELLLTPRGLLALTRKSLRSVRQQVKALEDVGEELVSGGKELLSSPPLKKR